MEATPPGDLSLFLLLGQSNMAGRGALSIGDRQAPERVWMFDDAAAWAPAIDPLHADRPTAGVGLGRSFGITLTEALPALRVGLVPCAVGGSSLEEWRPEGALYARALERARGAAARGKLCGVLWHQGETDALEERAGATYAARFDAFATRLRRDLGDEELPLLVGQLGEFLPRHAERRPGLAAVRRALATVESRLPAAAYVSSTGLVDGGDRLHFDASSLREFGRRYAAAYLEFHHVRERSPDRFLRRVAVTGGSGKAGRHVVAELVAHGYEVVNLDSARPPAGAPGQFLETDLGELGQAVEALAGLDAVVHLAAIPSLSMALPAVAFHQNIRSTFNVFQAARLQRLRRVVWASSEMAMGVPYTPERPPVRLPLDESAAPCARDEYALSKVAAEAIAAQYAEWTGVPFVGLRYSYVWAEENYRRFQSSLEHPNASRRNGLASLWTYVDVRDAARATRLALEAPLAGAINFHIGSLDVFSPHPVPELVREFLPGVPVRSELVGSCSLISNERARRLLGYLPRHSWRHREESEFAPSE